MHCNNFLALLILFIPFCLISQPSYDYYDGPYIFDIEDNYEILWVENGEKKDSLISKDDPGVFDVKGLPKVDLADLTFPITKEWEFDAVDSYVALSDIHGQYDVFVELLQSQLIIDQELNWIFGEGHLVIVGDVLDRGPKVTECLWLLFALEKQALAQGGRVHYILGNHELMVLHRNVKYVNLKYRYTSGIHQVQYPELYGENTVLGKWLRSKFITVKLNDVGFVHGGYSKKVIDMESDLQLINNLTPEILANPDIAEDDSSLLSMLYFENGPLWYREYANPDGFDQKQLDYILRKLQLDAIVVGHTSMPKIISRNQGRVYLIDSSMKFGSSGELLRYHHGTFFRGLLNGEVLVIDGDISSREKSTFQYIYELKDSDLTIHLDTDAKTLIKSPSLDYQNAKLIAIHNEEVNRAWEVKVKKRGNMRKEVCMLPPLKIDFSKSTLDNLGFDTNDKLKLVLPCDETTQSAEKLFREEAVYRLYQVIDPLGFRTRIINLAIVQEEKMEYELNSFFVEDKDNYSLRAANVELVEHGILKASVLNRDNYLKMIFFQYLIRNSDWSVTNRHNMVTMFNKEDDQYYAIPYDFDYSGIVNQEYAIPPESVPIVDVEQAHFRGKDLTVEEMEGILKFFNSIRQDLENVVDESDYLNPTSKKRFHTYVKEFYQDLENKKRWNNLFSVVSNG